MNLSFEGLIEEDSLCVARFVNKACRLHGSGRKWPVGYVNCGTCENTIADCERH
jgi:hypothetical protein